MTATYGTEAAARAYVAAVLETQSSLPPGTSAYLAVRPDLRTSPRWVNLAAGLTAVLPGVAFRQWEDLDAADRGPELAAALAAAHRAVIAVIPPSDKYRKNKRPVSRGVLGELETFAAVGRPALVYTGSRLIAWPDIRVSPVSGDGWKPAAWLRFPDPPALPLPTLAVSLRVLGITDPAVIAQASGSPAPPQPPPARSAPPRAVFRPGRAEMIGSKR